MTIIFNLNFRVTSPALDFFRVKFRRRVQTVVHIGRLSDKDSEVEMEPQCHGGMLAQLDLRERVRPGRARE